MPNEPLVFFLGGYDLEMVTIRDLVHQVVPERVHDKRLAWGAKASAYSGEIRQALARGLTSVLVELVDDQSPGLTGGLDATTILVADHHGERAPLQPSHVARPEAVAPGHP